MRATVLLLLGLAACELRGAEDYTAGDDGAMEPDDTECASVDHCVLASSTCCGCAEFATPDLGWAGGCEDVECPAADPSAPACPALEVACVEGACTTACAPVTCELSCDGGFATDGAGCLVCACAGGPAPPVTCTSDDQCVQIPADCCGCARGGADTAAPADTAEDVVDSLMCPDEPACPEVDVCDPTATPRCIGGTCALVPGESDALDVGCGRPDLPPCPEGTVCVLNADSDASEQGVGTCQ